MEPGFAQQLLTLWEQGHGQSVIWRGLLLLSLAVPDTDWHTLAEMHIGERDGRLLVLYQQLFGTIVEAVATCPCCKDQTELRLSAAAMTLFDPEQAVTKGTVTVKGRPIQFRLPNSHDLLAVASLPDTAQVQHHLLLRCLMVDGQLPQKRWQKRLPEPVQTAVVSEMASLDPQGNIELLLTCPACDHQWPIVFDIVTFLWHRLDRWAKRTMQEIHTLAVTYGWAETDILNLSPWRRQLYLQMVGG